MEVQADVTKFCSKLDELRQNKLHCDVNLQIGQQVFPCHKVVLSAASHYFSTMFHEKFSENKKENIALNNIDEDVFEKILSFMYTGKITVTDEDSYTLLVASEYLGLQFIEDLCTNYISKNVPLSNATKIFLFAYKTGKTTLIEILSQYIMENIANYCNEPSFLEIPSDAAKMIFNAAADQRDELLLAIIRWIRHSYDQRKEMMPELLNVIDFEKVSASFVQLLTECVIEVKQGHQNLREKCGNSHWLPAIENLLLSDKVLENVSPLNVYVTSALDSTSFLHHYGVDKNYQWCDVANIRPKKTILNCKNVALGEKLHSFHYYYTRNDKNADDGPYLQHVYTRSTCMHKYSKALSPPCETAHFDACSVQTNIYFYNRALSNSGRYARSNAYSHFTSDEISRGIYSYNSELNDWYPVPAQKLKLDGSYLLSCDDVIYLLGGYPVNDDSFIHGYAQSYDHRMATWNKLPGTTFLYKDASACTHHGKIYIAGGSCCPRGVEVFDSRAGKWETMKPMNYGRILHKLTSYNNYLWAIGNATDLSVEIYDHKANHWINTTSMTKAVKAVAKGTPGYWHSHKVLDAVIFEYYKGSCEIDKNDKSSDDDISDDDDVSDDDDDDDDSDDDD